MADQPRTAKGKPLPDDPDRRDAASRLDEAAVAVAAAFWDRHSPVPYRGLVGATPEPENGPRRRRDGPPVWLWLMVTRAFAFSLPGSKPLPRPEVRDAVDAVVTAAENEAVAVSDRLREGETDIAGWQSDMEGLVLTAFAAVAAVGAGGRLMFGSAERRRTSRLVRAQLDFLAGFAAELADGLPLDGNFPKRSAMYGSAATNGYERVLRDGDLDAGWGWERRILNARRSCSRCVSHAGRGWQPAGTLPDVGEDCECGSNCKCTFERSDSRDRPGDFAMPTSASNGLAGGENCRRRARLAALKGHEAVPVRLAGPGVIAAPPGGAKLVTAFGSLPATDAEKVERVNAVLHAQGLPPLRADQVHFHEMEAGSTHYIPSRSAFLADSTVRNVARGAQPGFAFMNSHRTGGLSSPAELPYGRTFAGRYESYDAGDGRTWSRAMVSFYMLRGVKPNGDSGPTTDDLSAGINAGTVFDVSLGVSGFKLLCDVCGHDLAAYDEEGVALCRHVPGTTHAMEKKQVKSQKDRGVPGGVATYSLHDGYPSEVSAVFNGAVPGAGFTRALSSARSGLLTPAELAEARAAYGHLLSPRAGRTGLNPQPRPRGKPMRFTLADLVAKLSGMPADTVIDDDADEFSAPPATPKEQAAAFAVGTTLKKLPDPEMVKLQEQLASTQEMLRKAEEARLKSERDALVAGFNASAASFCDEHKAALTGHTLPKVKGLFAQLAADDHDHPVEGFSRVEALAEFVKNPAPHEPGKPAAVNTPAGGPDPEAKTFVLPNDREGYDPVKEAREQNAAVLGKPRNAAG